MISSSSIKILVVDDEPSIRGSLLEYLDDLNYDVTSAGSGEEALELIAGNRYNLGIIDLRLPGMNGDVLIKNAHQIDPEMQFIIHTGSIGYKISQDLINIGMKPEHVFLKPLTDLSKISKTIQKLFFNQTDG